MFPTKTALPAEECIPLALIRSHFNGNENVANLNSSRQNTVEAECSDTEFLSAPSLIFIGRAAAAEAAANNEFVDETETEGQKEMEKVTQRYCKQRYWCPQQIMQPQHKTTSKGRSNRSSAKNDDAY